MEGDANNISDRWTLSAKVGCDVGAVNGNDGARQDPRTMVGSQ